LWGDLHQDQPSQKAFESRIAMSLAGMDQNRPVFIEAESNKIGARIVPPSLWQAMLRADHIHLSAPLPARAKYLVETYGDLLNDVDLLEEKLGILARFHGHERVSEWQGMARAGAFEPLARALVQTHYDPRYQRSSCRAGPALMQLSLAALDGSALQDAAARISSLDKSA
jgi:tRNA 2-selenouridine synthase